MMRACMVNLWVVSLSFIVALPLLAQVYSSSSRSSLSCLVMNHRHPLALATLYYMNGTGLSLDIAPLVSQSLPFLSNDTSRIIQFIVDNNERILALSTAVLVILVLFFCLFFVLAFCMCFCSFRSFFFSCLYVMLPPARITIQDRRIVRLLPCCCYFDVDTGNPAHVSEDDI